MQSLLKKVYEAKWVLLGIALLVFLLGISVPFISPIVFALFMYYITRPMKRKLQHYIKNEALLALACLLLLTLPLVLLFGYVTLFAMDQLFSLLAQPGMPLIPSDQLTSLYLPHNLSELNYKDLPGTLSNWYNQLKIHSDSIVSLRNLLFATGMSLASAAFNLLLMFILAFFFLLDDDRLARWFKATFPRLVEERNSLFLRYAKAVDEDFEHIFYGNMLNIVFFAIIAAVIYWLLGIFAPDPAFVIPVPLLLGILSGIAALLPVLGGWAIDIPILLYVLARSLLSGSFETYWWYLLVMAMVIFVFVENLPNYLVRPFVANGKVDVGLLMLAYILGPVIFGFPGLFLGAMVLVIITHYFKIVVPDLQDNSKPDSNVTAKKHRRRHAVLKRKR